MFPNDAVLIFFLIGPNAPCSYLSNVDQRWEGVFFRIVSRNDAPSESQSIGSYKVSREILP